MNQRPNGTKMQFSFGVLEWIAFVTLICLLAPAVIVPIGWMWKLSDKVILLDYNLQTDQERIEDNRMDIKELKQGMTQVGVMSSRLGEIDRRTQRIEQLLDNSKK